MGLYNLCSENRDADQLGVNRTSDLGVFILTYAISRFSHDAAQ